jgi:hypothetical protein
MIINSRRRLLACLIFSLSFPLVSGCGEREEEEEKFSRRTITVKDVPAAVMESAAKELPGVDFTEAWKNVDADSSLHSYEIRGRNAKGKIREVRIAADGKILEIE